MHVHLCFSNLLLLRWGLPGIPGQRLCLQTFSAPKSWQWVQIPTNVGCRRNKKTFCTNFTVQGTGASELFRGKVPRQGRECRNNTSGRFLITSCSSQRILAARWWQTVLCMFFILAQYLLPCSLSDLLDTSANSSSRSSDEISRCTGKQNKACACPSGFRFLPSRLISSCSC